MHGHEWLGVPAEWGYDTSAPYGVEAPQRAAMSCGLCGQLAQAIGPPPYMPPEAAAKAAATAANDDAEAAAAEVDAWDLRPFGVWLATRVLPTQGLARTLGTLNKYRAAGGDVVLGFLRQGLRLQAQASGTMEGRRKRADALSSVAAQEWAQSVCRRMWPMSLQASYDCNPNPNASPNPDPNVADVVAGELRLRRRRRPRPLPLPPRPGRGAPRVLV